MHTNTTSRLVDIIPIVTLIGAEEASSASCVRPDAAVAFCPSTFCEYQRVFTRQGRRAVQNMHPEK